MKAKASVADAAAWGSWALAEAETVLKPAFLASKGRASLRELTQPEWVELEHLKFGVLCATAVGTKPTYESVGAFLKTPTAPPEPVQVLVQAATAKYVAREGREPPQEQARQIRAAAYAIYAFEPADGVIDCTEE